MAAQFCFDIISKCITLLKFKKAAPYAVIYCSISGTQMRDTFGKSKFGYCVRLKF